MADYAWADGAPAGDVIYAGYADHPPALPQGWRFEPLGRRADLTTVGHDLYDALRRFDAAGPRLIVVELTGANGIGRAIDDRLTRAASGIVAASSADLTSHALDALR